MKVKWSAYGDLYDGERTMVYHWQETSKWPGSRLKWEFDYCGDNGKAHIWIDPGRDPRARRAFLNLDLDRDYCWRITGPVPLVFPCP